MFIGALVPATCWYNNQTQNINEIFISVKYLNFLLILLNIQYDLNCKKILMPSKP